ncbi:type II toxin-antitoxin system RelE/ParE family toxin [Phytoactinopolyspora halotolerans]|uniref:DNA-binding protein n=1 Tax=Phytoactinopolyspora halotolerans TaxID=1981512 RepID=A0A6L9SBK7_9ACTN|nr:type II toxin-antitoxin system RelE/ParE family toxin [Phytoactinopolyspora halotolerans]NEE02646.1 DNA-binding protein [Phytoactinopolyspora halotolerans]
MAWEMILVDEVDEWFMNLVHHDKEAAAHVEAAIDLLAQGGPALGRPYVDTIHGSRIKNLKELRPSNIRILFVFDPQKQAVLLIAGDQAGQWKQWYRENIPVAEQRYQKWLDGGYEIERKQ